MKTVLIVVAHPDDEVLGMGGTIAKLANNGVDVHLLIVTDGSSSQYRKKDNVELIIERKKIETKESCKILGIKTITYGKLPDMKLDTVPHTDINNVIEKTISRLMPDTVFTHFYGDINLDHQLVFKSVLVACRPTINQPVKSIFCFEVPSSTEWNEITSANMFVPNYFVDISAFLEIKQKAFSCYKTELRDYPHPRSNRYIEEKAKIEGAKFGMNFIERFMLIRHLEK